MLHAEKRDGVVRDVTHVTSWIIERGQDTPQKCSACDLAHVCSADIEMLVCTCIVFNSPIQDSDIIIA